MTGHSWRCSALKTKKQTPKYGLIYHASLVGQSAPKNKGKVSRILASKAALSVRYDSGGFFFMSYPLHNPLRRFPRIVFHTTFCLLRKSHFLQSWCSRRRRHRPCRFRVPWNGREPSTRTWRWVKLLFSFLFSVCTFLTLQASKLLVLQARPRPVITLRLRRLRRYGSSCIRWLLWWWARSNSGLLLTTQGHWGSFHHQGTWG